MVLFVFQKVKKVFPLAEEIKSKLKKKYTEEEERRQIEEVGVFSQLLSHGNMFVLYIEYFIRSFGYFSS